MKRPMPLINWAILDSVKRGADSFGPGFLVVREKGASSFRISHANRRDVWDFDGNEVWYASKGTPMPAPRKAILK